MTAQKKRKKRISMGIYKNIIFHFRSHIVLEVNTFVSMIKENWYQERDNTTGENGLIDNKHEMVLSASRSTVRFSCSILYL